MQLRPLSDVPFAVVDVETTGLVAGAHPIIEIGIVHYRYGEPPVVALDTLVNPGCRADEEEVHGISREQLADAPSFAEIAGDILEALAGRVVAAHNAEFDRRFLQAEFHMVGLDFDVPTVCTMRLLPGLGVGPFAPLDELRRHFGMPAAPMHTAAADAGAAAYLLGQALHAAMTRQIPNLGELGCPASVKISPRPLPDEAALPPSGRRRPRTLPSSSGGLPAYAQALISALSDGVVDDDEIEHLRRLREEARLPDEAVRAIHAQAFAGTIAAAVVDQWLDDNEAELIANMRHCLERLGWAP